MKSSTRAAVALCTAVLPLVVGASAASAAPSPDRASATWLSRQLEKGLVHNDQYGFDDYGLSADVALALHETGRRAGTVQDIRRALARHVDSWTTGVDFDTTDVYAGSVAKAVVVAQTTGADPRSFGGVDLVKRLNARVSSEAPTVGRIQDKGAADYANTIGQAFAVRGLAKARSTKADEALAFLLKQQCSAGYFRLNFAEPGAADQSCDGGRRASTSAPDTDVTALAVLSLRALKNPGREVRTATSDAVRWLKRHQKDNGSFGGGPATERANANSTGLAAWALGKAGACKPARQAARWVDRIQVAGDVAGTPLAGERGAIAYDRAAMRAAKRDGIGVEQRDQWRRATAQAAPGLVYLSLSACRNR
jgi:hypothetical protein